LCRRQHCNRFTSLELCRSENDAQTRACVSANGKKNMTLLSCQIARNERAIKLCNGVPLPFGRRNITARQGGRYVDVKL